MTKSFTLHRSKGVRDSPCFQTVGVEGDEKKRLGQEPPIVTSEEESQPAAGATLPGWQVARNGDGACLRERGREEHGSQRRLGEKERVGSGAREGISRRKWALQPSQNWLKTAQFSESGTAGHNGWHCRPANFAGITQKLYDLLNLRYGYIFSKYHDQ